MSENKKAQTIVHLSDVLRLLPYLIAWGLASIIRELRLLVPWERAAVLAVATASWFTFSVVSGNPEAVTKPGRRKVSRKTASSDVLTLERSGFRQQYSPERFLRQPSLFPNRQT